MRRSDRLELALFEMACGIARRLPLWVLQATFSGLARLIVASNERRVHWARVNLRIAYPEHSEAEHRALVRASYVNLAWNFVDLLRVQSWSAREIREHVALEGFEHLREALSEGRGAVLIVPHLGQLELGVQALALAGIDCVVVERVLPNRRLYARLRSARARFGAEPIDRVGAMRPMVRALRKGRCVVVALDQFAGRSGRVFVPFFGVRVATSSVVALLAERTQAAVLPACVVRDGADHHRARILPRLTTPRTGDRQADVEAATALYTSALEHLIRSHPEQWMWAYRRFRGSPDLLEDPYARRGLSPWRCLRRGARRGPRAPRGAV